MSIFAVTWAGIKIAKSELPLPEKHATAKVFEPPPKDSLSQSKGSHIHPALPSVKGGGLSRTDTLVANIMKEAAAKYQPHLLRQCHGHGQATEMIMDVSVEFHEVNCGIFKE